MTSSMRWHAARREAQTYDQIEIPTLLYDSPRVNPLDVDNNPDSDDTPPSYENAIGRASTRLIPQSITYTFKTPSSTRRNVISVVPSTNSTRTHAMYQLHITKNAAAYTTSISIQGYDGEMIGDFEMGYTQKSGSVAMRGQSFIITEVLTRSNMCVGRGVPWKERQRQASKNVWQWKLGHYTKRIFWDVTNPGMMTCYSSNTWDRAVRLAVFTYALSDAPKALEIYPEGHEVVEDILISGLILERWKLEMVV
ncbi:hypothetical protein BDZ89DRAFT_1063700 [Hymenopellis radicata]|nr:hypothetical protein BDZ89DRAFT_1063700 [Hymenopellis radicata]